MRNYKYTNEVIVPADKKTVCKICHYSDYTQTGDLDSDYHKGFTIGKNGKTLYWEMIWHGSGHVTVFKGIGDAGRWISGDTEIIIHWK
jgi:hypothetical protein